MAISFKSRTSRSRRAKPRSKPRAVPACRSASGSNSVISDHARNEGLEPSGPARGDDDAADADERAPGRHPHPDHDDHHRRAPAEDIAEVRGRLDEVGRQLDQLSRHNATQAYLRPNLHPEEPPRELTDVLWKLDRRLDQLIASGRAASEAVERRFGDRDGAGLAQAAPAHNADASTPLEQALMEIAERQRALEADGGPSANPSSRSDVLPRAPTQGLSNLEEQLRNVTTRIETLRPCGVNAAVETLRDDLAEIGLMLKEAMPRQSIEALESEVRGLSERLSLSRPSDDADVASASVERGLAEIRDALRALTPAENLVGVDATVRELSRKIDLIASNSQDPAAMEQLEGAIVGLRGIASQVASDGALAKLSDEVRGLAAKVDRIASSAELLSTLEHRISSMADVLESRHQIGAAARAISTPSSRASPTGWRRSDSPAPIRPPSASSRTGLPIWSTSSTPPMPASIISRRSRARSAICWPSWNASPISSARPRRRPPRSCRCGRTCRRPRARWRASRAPSIT